MTTQDIDIGCDFSFENLLRLQSALNGLNPIHRMTTKQVQLELTEALIYFFLLGAVSIIFSRLLRQVSRKGAEYQGQRK